MSWAILLYFFACTLAWWIMLALFERITGRGDK